MLNVDRALQINVALLVILGSLLLGLGNSNATLPMLASLAAITSLYVTDIWGIFSFNRFVANLAAILAATYAIYDFFSAGSESQLVSIASFLIYLQIILLFQPKTSRLYWQLLVLSLLQVVVAAALTVRVESGALFLLYIMLALSAMTLTYVHRENQSIKRLSKRAKDELTARSSASRAEGRGVLLRGAPVMLFDHTHRDQTVLRRLIRHGMMAGCGALVFAAIYFYSIPRSEQSLRNANLANQTLTGFSHRIRFNNKGLISPTGNVYFRAKFIDARTGEPMSLQSEPYFRGLVLNTYRKNRGAYQWDYRPFTPQRRDRSLDGPIPDDPLTRTNTMKAILQVSMEPNEESILFSSFPTYRTANTRPKLYYDYRSYGLLRDTGGGPLALSEYEYEVAVELNNEKKQSDMYPYLSPNTRDMSEGMDLMTRANLLSHPVDDQPEIQRLTRELLQDIPRADVRQRAEKLSNHLRVSPRYRYTLDLRAVEMNRDLDSTEDFIANHRSGHCEFFASALCMMLRHAGIPARVVMGFRCGNYNSILKHYVVQDQHAHAWVEAYIPRSNVTNEEIAAGLAGEGGAWLRLDPTPMSSRADENMLATNDALDVAQMLWDDFVYGLNSDRQQTFFFSNMFSRVPMFDSLVNGDMWNRAIEDMSTKLGLEQSQGKILVQVVVIVTLVSVVLGYWGVMIRRRRKSAQRPPMGLRGILSSVATIVSPRLGQWIAVPEPDPLVGEPVDFYEQLSSVLQKHGYRRAESQSQSEFVQSVLDRLQGDSRYEKLAPILPRIVDAFYLVRFGRRSLSSDESKEIQSWIGSLESELQTPNLAAGNSAS